jgi:hypothetical protein
MQTTQELQRKPETETNFAELNELELALVGGGIGDTAV